ncbi:unnamed protein product [Schistosoma mattheei]|uniref:Uncharacterized protein n=1 Tax=Schistosoma mattheei TaxID=31246 RepID=A0A3P8I1C1_9TREM|nr:unnamed protein product [Schistosoma mattheei]
MIESVQVFRRLHNMLRQEVKLLYKIALPKICFPLIHITFPSIMQYYYEVVLY